jgi:CheY-like chemotaxis protein
MDNIKDSAQHLLNLINNILDVSKIEAGQLTLNIESVDAKNIFQTSLCTIEPAAHNKNLEISSAFDNNVSTIQADALRLKQVLVNLLNNAVKFTPKGGAIGLEVHGDVDAGVVHFTVWDTGIGIAEDDFSRIFDPFVQLDSSLTREYEGSGLGLALARNLAEMHGGNITVESEVGKGSRFTISLPWNKPESNHKADADTAQETTSALMPPPHPDKQPLILVAEDNILNRKVLSELLLAEGYRTITAQDGAAAIRATRAHHPDVILMDIQMPGMDGLETTRRIRADTELKDTPIIAATALAMPGDRERCLAAGANQYMNKPIDTEKLLRLINELLRKDDTDA